jgi:hypothetical protein
VVTWIAAILTIAVAIAYVPLAARNPSGRATVFFVAAFLVLMAALLLRSMAPRVPGSVRMSFRAGAGGGLLVLGVLALMSIGLPLILAGLAAFVAAGVTGVERPLKSALFSGVAALLAVVVLITGFEVTQRIVACPPHGSMSGSGTGFITGPYQYECVDGRLNWRSNP